MLADNRTSNPLLETEHGLSILLETARHRVLLDTGASDLFIRNADRLGIDLDEVDYVFISHGHADHAGGLRHFLNINSKARIIVSPDALTGEYFSKRRFLHSITTTWPHLPQERMLLISQTCEIDEGLHVIGGFHLLDGQESDDELFALGTRLKEKYPQTQFYTSHCTGDRAFQRLKSVMGPQLNTFI
ncbi:MAG: MBL fold metallo-hydrolase [Bacteroidales bacterium]|nr:MBL fold metallo-hydrolase [Bacteroidales bacterium]